MNEYMQMALEEARKAYAAGEVPIGAVVVRDGEVLARAHNLVEGSHDCTAHAELLAIRGACERLGNERLTGCDMYVTAEPCCMCAGALVWARVRKLYIGAADPKAGACGSLYNIVSDERLNHRLETESGVDGAECGALLKDFFRELRNKKAEEKKV